MDKDTENIRYIIIPLRLIKDLIMKDDVIYKMLCLGIYRFSKTLKVDTDSAIKEAVYCFYHKKNSLSAPLLLVVSENSDEYYRGYGSEEYAEADKDLIRPVLEEKPELEAHIMEWYRVRQVLKLFKIDVPFRDILRFVEDNREELEAEGVPNICVNIKFITNRTKDAKEGKLTANQRAALAMYFGMLSIIGTKKYAATTADTIICRMFGAKNKEELSVFCEDEAFQKIYKTYSTRRKYYTLLEDLKASGLITHYSRLKRTYISVKIKSPDALVKAIKKDDKASRIKEINEATKAATEKYFGKK